LVQVILSALLFGLILAAAVAGIAQSWAAVARSSPRRSGMRSTSTSGGTDARLALPNPGIALGGTLRKR